MTISPDDLGDPIQNKEEKVFTLSDLYESDKSGTNIEIGYEYDFGDDWHHSVTLLGRADSNLRRVLQIPDKFEAFCMAGEGHHCAEDCGGSSGWEGLKNVFKKGRKDPEGLRSWYKNECINGDKEGLDPYKWDMLEVNDGLLALAKGEL